MSDFLGLLAAPFMGCLLIAALHCYMGLHVVRRGVIFVDLALAQLAALGATVALLVVPLVFGEPVSEHHHEQAEFQSSLAVAAGQTGDASTQAGAPPSDPGEKTGVSGTRAWLLDRVPYAMSLLFTIIGAALFALTRFRHGDVPHEAIIGIVYVVSAALAVLVLSKAPHGHEQMEAMLVGSILFVSWKDVLATFLLYLPLAILHFAVRRRLLLISDNVRSAEAAGVHVRAWDFLFYVTFGLMVTQSVKMAGVLVVFSYLIIPAVCASMLVKGFASRLILSWGLALLASVIGLMFSAAKDMPTGPALVAVFGAILVITAIARPLVARVRRASPRLAEAQEAVER